MHWTVVNVKKPPSTILHRNQLLNLMFELGFARNDLRLLYLKINYKEEKPEYAWVAFENHELALKFWEKAETRKYAPTWVEDFRKLEDPSQLLDLQSLTDLEKWFKKNAMMHPDVRSDLRPCFYEAGKQMPFSPQPDLKPPAKTVLEQIRQFLEKRFPEGAPEVIKEGYEKEPTNTVFQPVQEHTRTILERFNEPFAAVFAEISSLWNRGETTDQGKQNALELAKAARGAETRDHNSW